MTVNVWPAVARTFEPPVTDSETSYDPVVLGVKVKACPLPDETAV